MAKPGQPPKYKSVEDTTQLNNNSFKKEKVLLDYIVNNIKDFVKDILGDELVSFECEKQINGKQVKLSPRQKRVDIYIVGRKSKYIIELKNPKYPSENRKAIGQLLDYGREYYRENIQMVLLTTLFDMDTAKTIEYYNLPIRYIYFDKDKSLEFKESLDSKTKGDL